MRDRWHTRGNSSTDTSSSYNLPVRAGCSRDDVMADKAMPPQPDSEPEQSSPAPKRSKPSEATPCLESNEVLAASSDESFGDDTSTVPTGQQQQHGALRVGRTRQQLLDDEEDPEFLKGEHAIYQRMSMIGDGAYGTVYKARDSMNGSSVALKKVRVPVNEDGLPTTVLREIAALKQLECFEHPQIVKLLDVCQGNLLLPDARRTNPNADNSLPIWLVFEHVDRDLTSFINSCHGRNISPALVRQMSREILSGVDFLHSHRIIHRDLKPQNLLVTKDFHVKIADFGLAKTYDFDMRLTSVVVTLWYRAPEVLLGCTYATPIDVWAVGCILAEINGLKPLFPGTSEGDQLDKIFKIIGSPSKEQWPDSSPIGYSAFPFRHPKPMKTVLPHLNDAGLDLITNMITFDPHRRITAAQALKHPYFIENQFA